MTTNEKIKGIRFAILSAVCMGMLSFFEAATIAEGLAPSELAIAQGVIALASALVWTIYLMYVEHSGLTEVDPAAFNAFSMLFGLPVTLALSLCAGDLGTGNVSAKTLFLLLALLVVNVVANLTLVSAVKCIGASLASAFSPLEPIVSAALGFLILRDPFHVRSAFGCALVLLSVVLIALDNYHTGKSA